MLGAKVALGVGILAVAWQAAVLLLALFAGDALTWRVGMLLFTLGCLAVNWHFYKSTRRSAARIAELKALR